MSATTTSRTPLPSSLAGASVLVVGGTSGIGHAAARLLAGLGAHVTVAARSADGLATTARALPTVRTRHVDVTDPTSLDALFESFSGGAGDPLDHVYVTAAAVLGGPVLGTDPAAVADVIDSRIWGAYAIARRAAPLLRPGGSLTFTSATTAARPVPGTSVIAASNAGVEAFVRTLAVEIAPLRANVVRPGGTDTPALRAFYGTNAGPDGDAAVSAAGARLLLGRFAAPDEVAAAALFLMANPYVTGSVVTVDGGTSLV